MQARGHIQRRKRLCNLDLAYGLGGVMVITFILKARDPNFNFRSRQEFFKVLDMFCTSMRSLLESKLELPNFQASPSSHSIGYVGSCRPFVTTVSSSACLFCFEMSFPSSGLGSWPLEFKSLTQGMSLCTGSFRLVITSLNRCLEEATFSI